MFYTLQELMAQIKGWEYLIAVAFLLLFIGFWMLLVRQPQRGTTAGPQMIATLSGSTPQDADLAQRAQACWDKLQSEAGVVGSRPIDKLSPLPCWAARQLVTGSSSPACAQCPVYAQSVERLVEKARRAV